GAALGITAGEVIVQAVLALAGRSLETWLLASPSPDGGATDPGVGPPRGVPGVAHRSSLDGFVMGVMSRCAYLAKDLTQLPLAPHLDDAAGGSGGGGDVTGSHVGPQLPPPAAATAALTLLGAAGKGLVTRVLPLGMLQTAVSEQAMRDGPTSGGGAAASCAESHVVFAARLPGLIPEILAELGGAKTEALGLRNPASASLPPGVLFSPGAGLDAALFDSLMCLAALLSCRKGSQLAAATVQALVQSLCQARTFLERSAADITSATTPTTHPTATATATASSSTASHATLKAANNFQATVAATAASAAVAELPFLPSGLWLGLFNTASSQQPVLSAVCHPSPSEITAATAMTSSQGSPRTLLDPAPSHAAAAA
ncbi:hypothetical protein Vafri_15146, partial [Volvox africanus]